MGLGTSWWALLRAGGFLVKETAAFGFRMAPRRIRAARRWVTVWQNRAIPGDLRLRTRLRCSRPARTPGCYFFHKLYTRGVVALPADCFFEPHARSGR
jgi:hypothetical protein